MNIEDLTLEMNTGDHEIVPMYTDESNSNPIEESFSQSVVLSWGRSDMGTLIQSGNDEPVRNKIT
jgi:hypothetical protein